MNCFVISNEFCIEKPMQIIELETKMVIDYNPNPITAPDGSVHHSLIKNTLKFHFDV